MNFNISQGIQGHTHTHSYSAVAALMWTNNCARTHIQQYAMKHTVAHIKQTEHQTDEHEHAQHDGRQTATKSDNLSGQLADLAE